MRRVVPASPGKRMDLFWMIVGLMAFCMPHLSASSVASIVVVAVECGCGVATKGAAGNLVLSFVGETIP